MERASRPRHQGAAQLACSFRYGKRCLTLHREGNVAGGRIGAKIAAVDIDAIAAAVSGG
jgi:hypothetical protein